MTSSPISSSLKSNEGLEATMHLLSLFDLPPATFHALFESASRMKRAMAAGVREPRCGGRVLGLLFEKPSLRTRVSFESGMAQLGGSSIYLGGDVGWGKRESLEDFARVLSSYVDVIAFRGFEHATLQQFAEYCRSPVINGLTNQSHPCQALGDLFTLHERLSQLEQQKLVFLGDANNVARSLAVGCAAVGMRLVLVGPEAYRFDPSFLDQLRSAYPSAEIEQTSDASTAVAGAAAIYTDVWTSMGFEAEQEARREAMNPYQVNEALLEAAGPQAVFMHCLPAKRGQEVTDAVMDGPQSVVVQQAENRMHIQKAIILYLLEDTASK